MAEKVGNIKQEPQTFDELFLDPYRKPEIIESFINVLREVTPPLINESNAVIKKYKTGFVIWVNLLKGEIIKVVDEKTYVRILNTKFHGLDFGEDAGIFRKFNSASQDYQQYKADLKSLISSVKISLPRSPKLP